MMAQISWKQTFGKITFNQVGEEGTSQYHTGFHEGMFLKLYVVTSQHMIRPLPFAIWKWAKYSSLFGTIFEISTGHRRKENLTKIDLFSGFLVQGTMAN